METPFYFNKEKNDLFGILHEPKSSNGEGIVFCHPFAEEKLWAHRVYVNFARKMTGLGYTALRFDYMGHGDSSGKFEDTTVESRLNDIAFAIKEIRERCPGLKKISLIGLRYGATLSAAAAIRDGNIDKLIMWEPITNGTLYMKELMRINLATQTAVYKEIKYNTKELIKQLKQGDTVNIDGYEIKLPLYEEIINLDLGNACENYNDKTLIVKINKRENMGVSKLNDLKKTFTNTNIIEVQEEPFWKEIKMYYYEAKNLYRETINWMRMN